MSQKILIDTDPGIDDSWAILAALRSPELDVLGLTTVFGNTDVDNCALNGLRLVELEGNDHIPVARGAGGPLVRSSLDLGTMVHGLDGMGNTNPSPPKGELDPMPAAQFIVDTIKKYPGEVTLVPLGPLTNIGLALHQAPEIASLVEEVVLMGGSVFAPGNISPLAEANVFHDPHAAELVFRADWDVTMIGLDVTTKILVRPADLDLLYAANNPASQLLREIQPCYQDFHDQFYGLAGAFHLHDPSVIAYLLAPELFSCIQAPVHVVTEGRCEGKTIADIHRIWGERNSTTVATSVDSKSVVELLTYIITH